jgi:hypothetical protein
MHFLKFYPPPWFYMLESSLNQQRGVLQGWSYVAAVNKIVEIPWSKPDVAGVVGNCSMQTVVAEVGQFQEKVTSISEIGRNYPNTWSSST